MFFSQETILGVLILPTSLHKSTLALPRMVYMYICQDAYPKKLQG